MSDYHLYLCSRKICFYWGGCCCSTVAGVISGRYSRRELRFLHQSRGFFIGIRGVEGTRWRHRIKALSEGGAVDLSVARPLTASLWTFNFYCEYDKKGADPNNWGIEKSRTAKGEKSNGT